MRVFYFLGWAFSSPLLALCIMTAVGASAYLAVSLPPPRSPKVLSDYLSLARVMLLLLPSIPVPYPVPARSAHARENRKIRQEICHPEASNTPQRLYYD
jgi:hypothetical protein